MTYFRYDGNKRGFDMSGIEWTIRDTTKLSSFTTSYLVDQHFVVFQENERFLTTITRNGVHLTNLYEQDTARFIEVITDAKTNRPKVMRSSAEAIELFLNPFKANAAPAPELLWYADGALLKHRKAPDVATYSLYVEERDLSNAALLDRVIEEQPYVTDSELHMLHSPNSDRMRILTMILDRGGN